jgi:hypothetical protein
MFTLFCSVSLLLCAYCSLLEAYGPAGYGLYFQPVGPEQRRYTAADINAFRLPPPTFEFLGFRVQKTIRADTVLRHGRLFVVPYWFLALLWAAAPAVGLRRLAKRWARQRAARRSRQGRCPSCGYDLRASPDRCPECGTAATPDVVDERQDAKAARE